jgi:hypothetical protein
VAELAEGLWASLVAFHEQRLEQHARRLFRLGTGMKPEESSRAPDGAALRPDVVGTGGAPSIAATDFNDGAARRPDVVGTGGAPSIAATDLNDGPAPESTEPTAAAEALLAGAVAVLRLRVRLTAPCSDSAALEALAVAEAAQGHLQLAERRLLKAVHTFTSFFLIMKKALIDRSRNVASRVMHHFSLTKHNS